MHSCAIISISHPNNVRREFRARELPLLDFQSSIRTRLLHMESADHNDRSIVSSFYLTRISSFFLLLSTLGGSSSINCVVQSGHARFVPPLPVILCFALNFTYEPHFGHWTLVFVGSVDNMTAICRSDSLIASFSDEISSFADRRDSRMSRSRNPSVVSRNSSNASCCCS